MHIIPQVQFFTNYEHDYMSIIIISKKMELICHLESLTIMLSNISNAVTLTIVKEV